MAQDRPHSKAHGARNEHTRQHGREHVDKKQGAQHDHSHVKDDIHLHEHEHDGVVHAHPHYHAPEKDVSDEALEAQHQHRHTYAFEVYSYADSSLHRLDARTKTLGLFGLIVAMVLTPISESWRFGLFLALIVGLYIVARVPFSFGLKRSAVVIPFVAFAGALLVFMPDKPHPPFYNFGFSRVAVLHGGLYIFFNALIKSWLSTLTAVLLYSTTPFPSFIKGLESLRVPKIITMLLSFLYRFMWVLTDEIKRMIRARDARAFGGSRLWHLQVVGQMVGSLFIRSYERAERVYAAMAARGYDGTIKTMDSPVLSWRDAAFSSLFLVALAAIFVWRP